MLRVQNKYAENKVQTRVQRVKRQRTERIGRDDTTIPRAVHISAEVHSWNRFYRDYAIHSGISLFNVLPRFYTSSSSTCFQEALQAVALVSSARQLHQSGLMVRARQHYGKAIMALNAALNDPVLTADDSVLVTLFLLSLFEMIIPEFLTSGLKDPVFRCHIHFEGALLLLRWRAERSRDSELDKSFLTFFSHICLMSMFINYEPFFDAKWLALEKFAAPWVKGPLLEPILAQTVDFKRRVHSQVTISHRPSRIEVIQLIKDGTAICENLKATATSVKSSSNPDLPSHQQPTAFNNMFEVSTKTPEAIARCLYDREFDPSLGSMILEQVCGEICTVLGLDGDHNMAEDEIGMAYRAYSIFWPLVVLLFSSLAGEKKRAWVQEKLRFIGETSGLGLATFAAGSLHTFRPA
ncbi:hypothetical protein CNMCM5623_003456 [Aspergillus felis]|uniref:C6 zinc finger domain protein n=1 Tax=Aspergillus felis TaxID=1287682 RepID=A0A8H6PPH4_9EURO|nr:hypothetical protein CNMCM5623_003456 [Aspergillus felis]